MSPLRVTSSCQETISSRTVEDDPKSDRHDFAAHKIDRIPLVAFPIGIANSHREDVFGSTLGAPDGGQPLMAISMTLRSRFLPTPLLACTARPELIVMR